MSNHLHKFWLILEHFFQECVYIGGIPTRRNAFVKVNGLLIKTETPTQSIGVCIATYFAFNVQPTQPGNQSALRAQQNYKKCRNEVRGD